LSSPLSSLGPHAWFIVMSYAAAVLGLGGLTVWIWLDGRAAKARLAALDARRESADRTTASRGSRR
jgi:heme exporter protein D